MSTGMFTPVAYRLSRGLTFPPTSEAVVSLALSFSIVGAVITFLISILGSLPLSGDAPAPAVTVADESFNVERVHEAAGLFSNAYTSLIDEMVSYQRDPDYHRAESRRRELADVGAKLVGDFQDFEAGLTSTLTDLTTSPDTSSP